MRRALTALFGLSALGALMYVATEAPSHPTQPAATPYVSNSVQEQHIAEMANDLIPGKHMKDGTIYAGISPDTHRPLFTTPVDAPLTLKWKQAMEYAQQLNAHGHKDWRVPTKSELNVLFQNRAAIGGFNETGDIPAGFYLSSTPDVGNSEWVQFFRNGSQYNGNQEYEASVRCVR